MSIEWNKVTWYSKLVAVMLFVCTFALAFYFGMEFQKVITEQKVMALNYQNPNQPVSNVGSHIITEAQFSSTTKVQNSSSTSYIQNSEPVKYINDSSFKLHIGDTVNNGNYSVKLNSIKEDSRCPVGVQCIQAGRVVANVTIKSLSNGKEIKAVTGDLIFDKNSYQAFSMPGYRIYMPKAGMAYENVFAIVDVLPSKKIAGIDINKMDYEITITIIGSVFIDY